MRIRVGDPALLEDLRDYLRRCNCAVEIRGRGQLEAAPATRNVEQAYLRMELDGYLRVWRLMHPDTDAVLLNQEPEQTGRRMIHFCSTDGCNTLTLSDLCIACEAEKEIAPRVFVRGRPHTAQTNPS